MWVFTCAWISLCVVLSRLRGLPFDPFLNYRKNATQTHTFLYYVIILKNNHDSLKIKPQRKRKNLKTTSWKQHKAKWPTTADRVIELRPLWFWKIFHLCLSPGVVCINCITWAKATAIKHIFQFLCIGEKIWIRTWGTVLIVLYLVPWHI